MTRFLLLALATSTLAIPITNAQGFGPFTCAGSVPVVPTYAPSAGSVVIGDLFVNCIGGAAFFPNPIIQLPTTDFTISLNTSILGATQPILMIDAPGSATNPNVLLCSSFIGCPMESAPLGTEPYDGSPGRPNIFLGAVIANQVTYSGIPIQPPVLLGRTLSLQFSDISIDAALFPEGLTVFGSLTIGGQAALPISNPVQELAVVTPEPLTGWLLGMALVTVGLMKRVQHR